jgi:hypothetical protein
LGDLPRYLEDDGHWLAKCHEPLADAD